MARLKFNPPLHWEAWCSWLLGLCLCISPGPLRFDAEPTATYASVLTGVLLICVEVITVSTFRIWEEWINVAIGVWLIAAPWVLNLSGGVVTANFVGVGAVVLALALYELRQGLRQNSSVEKLRPQ